MTNLTQRAKDRIAVVRQWRGNNDTDAAIMDQLLSEVERLTSERNQALAQAATAAMDMRERAAEHAWNKRDLLADAEKKQIDAGLTGRDYYGRRLEAEFLSRTIRALPIDGGRDE